MSCERGRRSASSHLPRLAGARLCLLDKATAAASTIETASAAEHLRAAEGGKYLANTSWPVATRLTIESDCGCRRRRRRQHCCCRRCRASQTVFVCSAQNQVVGAVQLLFAHVNARGAQSTSVIHCTLTAQEGCPSPLASETSAPRRTQGEALAS